MKDLPNAFWAAYFITIAMILVVVLLFSPSPENFKLAVLGFGSNIVTGAFAYIQGKRDGQNSVQVPLDGNNPSASTTVSVVPTQPQISGDSIPNPRDKQPAVGVDPTQPVDPAQPK
jgi:hypothetical protein